MIAGAILSSVSSNSTCKDKATSCGELACSILKSTLGIGISCAARFEKSNGEEQAYLKEFHPDLTRKFLSCLNCSSLLLPPDLQLSHGVSVS